MVEGTIVEKWGGGIFHRNKWFWNKLDWIQVFYLKMYWDMFLDNKSISQSHISYTNNLGVLKNK